MPVREREEKGGKYMLGDLSRQNPLNVAMYFLLDTHCQQQQLPSTTPNRRLWRCRAKSGVFIQRQEPVPERN